MTTELPVIQRERRDVLTTPLVPEEILPLQVASYHGSDDSDLNLHLTPSQSQDHNDDTGQGNTSFEDRQPYECKYNFYNCSHT